MDRNVIEYTVEPNEGNDAQNEEIDSQNVLQPLESEEYAVLVGSVINRVDTHQNSESIQPLIQDAER